MFPHDQGPQNGSLWRTHSLPPLCCLPKLHSHSTSVDKPVSFQYQQVDNSTYHQDTIPEHQPFCSVNKRPRGKSLEEDSVSLRTRLPSVTSLVPSQTLQVQHDSFFDSSVGRQQPCHTLASTARHQMPTLLHEHTRSPVASANALETAASLQIHRGLLPPSLTGSSAFPEQSNQIRRNRYDVPLNNRSFRRPFYNSTSTSVARGITSDPIAIPWKDAEDNTMQQSHRKQRTSPRRRLADSKVRAQAFQMREESEAFNHIEAKHLGYGLAEINRYEGAPTSFAPPFSAVSRRLPLPMSQSPIYFDSSITSTNKEGSRYMREMNRITTWDRRDCRRMCCVRADDIHATCAVCNLNKYREHDKDALVKSPKKARHKKISAKEIDSENAAPSFKLQSNRISLLLSDDTLNYCKD